MDTNNSLQKKMSNWDKPGGTLGLGVAAAAACGGVIFLYKILPYLITLTENIWYLALLTGGLIAVGWLLSNKTFQKTFSTAYFMIMRKITGAFIEIDPIAILKQGVVELEKKIKQISEQMNIVKGVTRKNKAKVEEKKKELETQLLKYDEYIAQGKGDYATVTKRQIERLTEAVEDYKQRLEESIIMEDVLQKMQDKAELVVMDTKNEVKAKEEKYEAIKAQHKAYKSFRSIIKGDQDDMDMFERAKEFVDNDIAMRIGEMSDMLDGTSSLIMEIDIENGITTRRATEILEKYKKGGLDAIFEKKDDETKMIEPRSSQYTLNFNTETQEPVLVEREDSEETVQRKYFDNY